MKLHFFVILLFLTPIVGVAQYSTPNLIANSGGSAIVNDMDIAWTLGEVVIITMEGSENILTNGFHQSDEFCFGDFNFDGEIASADLLLFLSEYNCITSCFSDLDGDGVVATSDLLILLAIFGSSCYGS